MKNMKRNSSAQKQKVFSNEKMKWTLLLLLAALLFLLGLLTQEISFFFWTIILAFYVRKNGYTVLFKEYDARQKKKRAGAEQLMSKQRQQR